MDSIKSLSNGKSPGQDGFGIEFYKKFAGKIIPVFHRILYLISHSTKACGQSTNFGKLGQNARKILVYCMVMAKRCILKLWNLNFLSVWSPVLLSVPQTSSEDATITSWTLPFFYLTIMIILSFVILLSCQVNFLIYNVFFSCEMFYLYLSYFALWDGKGPRNPGWTGKQTQRLYERSRIDNKTDFFFLNRHRKLSIIQLELRWLSWDWFR